MISPDDHQLAGTVGKTYLPYNEISAKLLATPVYYTDVCSVASPTDVFYSGKFKQELLHSAEESLDSPSSPLCVAKRTMCRNNAEKSESLSSIHKQGPSKQPPDKNAEHCESPDKNKSMCNASSSSGLSVISAQGSPTASNPKSTRDNLNTFLSPESNFRKFQFQERNLNNNCNLNSINNQILMGNSVVKPPLSTSDSEGENLERLAPPINPPTIDVIDLSDDDPSQPIPSLNLPEQEHNSSNSSSLDIKIVPQEPLASERLMPQLSPLDSDVSIVESVKDIPKVIEVISLPSSPEMPTLIPFTTETEEPLKESSSCVSDNESNSSHLKSFHNTLTRKLQPKVILERISLENCFTAQKKYKVSALEKHRVTVMQKRKQEKTPCKLPEIDVIDGLNFFSFSSKPEMERYCKENNYNVLFNIKENVEEGKFRIKEDLDAEKFDETESKNKFHIAENTTKDKLSLSQSSVIIPTKTTNVTQIKGWKNKHFSPESEFTSVFEDSSREESVLHESKSESVLHESKSESVLHESKSESVLHESKSESVLLEGPSNMSSDALHVNSADKKIIKEEKPVVVSSPKTCIMSNGAVVREFPTAVQGIFISDALDEFLEKDAELHVKLLQKVNPNIIPIPLDNPILSLGKLRKSDNFGNQMSRRSFMRRKNSLTPKSMSEPENKLIHNLTKHESELSSSSPILNDKKDSQNYAVTNAKRKFDGMHKSLKKAKLCKNRAGMGRLVLRLKKKYSGLSDEYKVDNVNKNSKTKSNVSNFKQENKSLDKNQLVVIKETSFSQNEEEEGNERVVLDKFLRNFNYYGTTTGLVDMLFASSGSIFSNNEVPEPNLSTSATSIQTLLNVKYSNAKIRPKKIRFSSTQLLTTKSTILDSDSAKVKEESASTDEVEDESSSEDEESESESSSEDTSESSTSDEDAEEESTSNDGVDEKLMFNDRKRVNCRNRSNQSYSFRNPAHENKVPLRNKRNTRMPKRLLDSAILAPGSEWVSPTLIEEKSTSRRVSKKPPPPPELNKHDLEHMPNMNAAKIMKIDSFNKLSPEKSVRRSYNAASGNKKPSDGAPLIKKMKRITKNLFCVCHNTTRTMAFDAALERLTCRCMLTALANFDSSVVDVTAIAFQNSRKEVESVENSTTIHGPGKDIIVIHDSPNHTTKASKKIVSSKMPESCKELGLHNYAANPNLEGISPKSKLKPASNMHASISQVSLEKVLTVPMDFCISENETKESVPHVESVLKDPEDDINCSAFIVDKECINAENSTISASLGASHTELNSPEMGKDTNCSDHMPLGDLPVLTPPHTLNNNLKYSVLLKNSTDTIKENIYAHTPAFNSGEEIGSSSDAKAISGISPTETFAKKTLPTKASIYYALKAQADARKMPNAQMPPNVYLSKNSVPLQSKPHSSTSPILMQPPNNTTTANPSVEQFKKQAMKMGFVFRTPTKTQKPMLSKPNSEVCNLSLNSTASASYHLSQPSTPTSTYVRKKSPTNNMQFVEHKQNGVKSENNNDDLVIDISDTESVQSLVDIESVDMYGNMQQREKETISDLSSLSPSSSDENDDKNDLLTVANMITDRTTKKSFKERMRRRCINNAATYLRKVLNLGRTHSKIRLRDLLERTSGYVKTLQEKNRALNLREYQLLQKREKLQARYRELVLDLQPEQRKAHASKTLSMLRTAVRNPGSRIDEIPETLPDTGSTVKKETVCIDLVDSEDEEVMPEIDVATNEIPDFNNSQNSQSDLTLSITSEGPVARKRERPCIESQVSQYNMKFTSLSHSSSAPQNSGLANPDEFTQNSHLNSHPSESTSQFQPTDGESTSMTRASAGGAQSNAIHQPLKPDTSHPFNSQLYAKWAHSINKRTFKHDEKIRDNLRCKIGFSNGKMMKITPKPSEPKETAAASPITTVPSGHQQIQSVFSALQQISRPASLAKQTTNSSFNTDSQSSMQCNMTFSSLPDMIPLQNENDIMDVGQVVDVTEVPDISESVGAVCDLKVGKSDEVLLEDFPKLAEVIEEPVVEATLVIDCEEELVIDESPVVPVTLECSGFTPDS